MHKPVLLNEVRTILKETKRPIKRFFDGTFGRGGHSQMVLQEFDSSKVVAFDRDHEAIEYAKKNFNQFIESGRLEIYHSNFINIDDFQLENFDAGLLDLGVSSPQLDEAQRGFSFYGNGPLDMRMDQREKRTAANIINEWDEDDLIELFREYGEVRRPERVVSAICEVREQKMFSSTDELSELIAQKDGWRQKGRHPATQYFMALRLIVNQELEVAQNSLEPILKKINHRGRLLVITFHSLEDRIVKYKFKELTEAYGQLVNKKVIIPQWSEQKENPRSRSAKLRAFERLIKEEIQQET